MNIVTIFSPNWINYFYIFAYSLFKNNKSPVKLYLFSDEITDKNLEQINKICDSFGEGYEIIYINALPYYNKLITSDINVDTRFTRYTLYKCLIAQLIPDERCLFLDGDTLVCGNLSGYYNSNFNGNYILGVEDTGLLYGYKTVIGLEESDIYINCGSVLFNLSKMREDNFDTKWINLINTQYFVCHEQCSLNLLAKNKIGLIDVKYNISLSTSLNYTEQNGIVFHYAGTTKPWSDKTVPYFEIWNKWENEYDSIFRN